MMKQDNNTNFSLTWSLISNYRDQIYGFSIIWIVMFHIWEAFSKKLSLNWVIIDIIKRGNMGVDIFLLLSGVSLYFAMKRNPNQTIRQFYKRRFSRIIKIYLTVCVPYFIFMLFSKSYSVNLFIKQLLFINKNVNSFWFLLIISICYAVYPLLYKLIESNRKSTIYLIILLYSMFLMSFLIIDESAYSYFEILLSRIPVFLFGATLGDLVYERKKMSSELLVISLCILAILGPVNMIIAKIPFLNSFDIVFNRYILGIQGFAVIIVFIAFIPFLKELSIFKYLGYLGTITLEVYVAHIILKNVAFNVLNIPIKTRTQILLFSIIYIPLSIALARILNYTLNYKSSNSN